MSEETRAGEGGEAPGPRGPGLQPGGVFAGHRIEAELGRGGMGVVYKATHLALDAPRALKVIAPGLSADSVFRKRFSRESRLAASIDHPNVVTVHHAGEETGLLYLSMRLVSGRDLKEIVESEGALDPSRAAAVISAVAAGLDAAHATGLVHRDVKPANVLIETTDAGERVFLTDFGISRVSGGGSTVTSTGELLGSVDYVAPEQIEGEEVGPAADIYSLGCLAMYALTGEPPFVREGDMARLYAHANAPRPRPSERRTGLPSSVDEAVMRAMAIRPADRFASASAMAGDLSRPLKRLGPDDVATRPIPQGRKRKRRIWPAFAGLAGAVVVAALVALFAFGGDDISKDDANPAEAGKVVEQIKVDGRPNGVAVGDLRTWVATTDSISSIGLTSNEVEKKIDLLGKADSVATGYGAVWVADHDRGGVVRLDPQTDKSTAFIPTGQAPSDVIAAYGSIWVCDESDNNVSRIDPEKNNVKHVIQLGASTSPRSLAAGDKAIWVANTGNASVSRIEAGNNSPESNPVFVGESPNDLDFGAGKLWVSDVFEGNVYEIDTSTVNKVPTMKVVGAPIPVGPRPRGIKYGFGSVWVASGAGDTVTRIDGETAKPYATPIEVGDQPHDIAVGDGSVWTADSGAGGEGSGASVTRIDPGE